MILYGFKILENSHEFLNAENLEPAVLRYWYSWCFLILYRHYEVGRHKVGNYGLAHVANVRFSSVILSRFTPINLVLLVPVCRRFAIVIFVKALHYRPSKTDRNRFKKIYVPILYQQALHNILNNLAMKLVMNNPF